MSATTLDQALDIAMQLSEEQQEMLLEILQRRQTERRRQEIAGGVKAALAEYRAAYSVAQPVDEVIAALHQYLDE